MTSVSDAVFFKRAVVLVTVALVPFLIWYLFSVVMIVIGALVLAILLRLGAEPFTRWLRLPQAVALVLSVVALIAFLGGAGYLFGARIGSELQDIFQRIASAQTNISGTLQQSQFGRFLLQHLSGGNLSLTDLFSSLFHTSTAFIEASIVLIITGIYFAAQPELYLAGLVQLFPPRTRVEVAETLDAIAGGLRLWLIGQLIQMVLIGVLTTFAVWLIGLPSPFALGVIAGIAEFIPYLGPIIAAIPAILVSITQGFPALIWTVVAYVVIHQVEGHVVVPLIQRQMIYIPPAVILLGVASIWFLFGAVSIVFAAPISVIIFVVLKKLYIRDTLREPTDIPGEGKATG